MNQSTPFTCSIATTFDFQSDDYKALFDRSNASTFQHPNWMQVLQCYAQEQKKGDVLTLLVRDAKSDQLILVLPLLLRKKGPFRLLEYLNMGFVDYAKPIYDPAFQSSLMSDQQILIEQMRSLLPSHDLLWIKHVPQGDWMLANLWPKAFQLSAGFGSHRSDLAGSFEDWQHKTMSKKRRGNMRRARQKLEERGQLQTHLLTDPQEIKQAFEVLRMFRHERFSIEHKAERLQDEAAFAFYLNLAKIGAKDGTACTYQLTLDQTCIAVTFGLMHRSDYVYLLPGADFATYGRYSPGALLLEDMIRDLMAQGIKGFDFSIGDEGYKQQFGTQPMAMRSLAHAATPLGALALLVIRLLKWQQSRAGLGRLAPSSKLLARLRSFMGLEKG